MMNVPLNILWRQCSELTCENPNTSESVNFLFIFLDKSSKYLTSSSLNARPSVLLYSSIFVISIDFSGCISIEKIF